MCSGTSSRESDVRKADTKALITNGTESFPEDIFEGQYWTGGEGFGGVYVIEPFYKPATLLALASQNNTLSQCIEAMEVNVDGTGHSIVLAHEDDKEDNAEQELLEDFFKEPYPGKSMIEIRRAIRRDLEGTGNGYLEVIRAADDTVVMLNAVSAEEVRLVRLDDAVTTTKTLVRGGKEIKVAVRVRERRFVQSVNGKKVYFKEFGATRDLDRNTGLWAPEGNRLPLEKRSSEILHFTGNKEPRTPYGAPRWINQMPSVLGSRKAEEYNVEFFDGGSIPPVMIMIEGGTLGEEMRNTLNSHLARKTNRHRAIVIEATSNSGSLDSSGAVRVKTERFGSMNTDAMFQNYDANTGEHVRMAFRLPSLFLGKNNDYSFATAYSSYLIAEAQVFYPERDEFDTKINNTVVKALGATKYLFHSLPLTLVDVANQIKALEMVTASQFVEGKEIVLKLNEITGLEMSYTEPPPPPEPPVQITAPVEEGVPTKPVVPAKPGKAAEATIRQDGLPQGAPTAQTVGGAKAPSKVSKVEESLGLLELASAWVTVKGLDGNSFKDRYSDEETHLLFNQVSELRPDEATTFNRLVAAHSLTYDPQDLPGLGELEKASNLPPRLRQVGRIPEESA